MGTFTIVACGESAQGWTPRGTCIGSNDCEKFGQPVDILILANHPDKFKERINIIKKSKATVRSNTPQTWRKMFPNVEKISRMVFFHKRILPGFTYTSKTTPIMCISTAINMGAKEVILYGVDMLTHHSFRRGVKHGDFEIATYLKFFKEMERLGIKVFLGAKGSAFDNSLPIYE